MIINLWFPFPLNIPPPKKKFPSPCKTYRPMNTNQLKECFHTFLSTQKNIVLVIVFK